MAHPVYKMHSTCKWTEISCRWVDMFTFSINATVAATAIDDINNYLHYYPHYYKSEHHSSYWNFCLCHYLQKLTWSQITVHRVIYHVCCAVVFVSFLFICDTALLFNIGNKDQSWRREHNDDNGFYSRLL